MLITLEQMDSAKTNKGGYTGLQERIAADLVGKGKGWRQRVMRTEVTQVWWLKFFDARKVFKNKKRNATIINTVANKQDENWKPKASDIPVVRKRGDKQGIISATPKQSAQHLVRVYGLNPDYLALNLSLSELLKELEEC